MLVRVTTSSRPARRGLLWVLTGVLLAATLGGAYAMVRVRNRPTTLDAPRVLVGGLRIRLPNGWQVRTDTQGRRDLIFIATEPDRRRRQIMVRLRRLARPVAGDSDELAVGFVGPLVIDLFYLFYPIRSRQVVLRSIQRQDVLVGANEGRELMYHVNLVVKNRIDTVAVRYALLERQTVAAVAMRGQGMLGPADLRLLDRVARSFDLGGAPQERPPSTREAEDEIPEDLPVI